MLATNLTPEEIFVTINNLSKRTTQSLSHFLVKRQAGLIVGLAFLIFITNLGQSRASDNFISTNNQETISITQAISSYTPLIDEDTKQLSTTLQSDQSGFLHKPSVADTIKSPTNYTIQEGDTISSIANQYGLTIATILDANNIKASDLDSIKLGQSLIIPPYSTNDSLAWLDETNKIKADKLAKAEQDKKKLALSKRDLTYRDTSTTRLGGDSSGAIGDITGGGSGIVPIVTKGISRGIGGGHTGIDYRADVGTPVIASRSGRVIEISGGWSGGWGKSVVISHGNGITTRYAHLSQPIANVGDTVSQGEIIGYSGNTGFSTGPHLHFEMRVNGQVANPYTEQVASRY